MEIITPDLLTKAIENRIDSYSRKKARRDAVFVLDIFGYEDRIIDNVLEPEERKLFYILEKEGMFEREREETILYNGRSWITHYWGLKKNTIIRYSSEPKPKVQETKKTENTNIYDTLSEEIWCRTPKPVI